MLKEILSIQSVSGDQWRMFAYLIRRLSAMEGVSYAVDDGNIYAVKGYADTYPCMVAHMDTVHDITDDLFPLEFNGMITGFDRVNMEQVGIGGDDKVGIYIALKCFEEFDTMKVAFFRDEEIGCHGSYSANMQFFEDCRFVLQCDRRGNSDFITDASGVELSSKHFQDDVLPIITGYGYKFAKGMMTDVMALKENGIKCSVANMSCGYYNPHAYNEYVDIYDVEQCLEMCKTIIEYCTDDYKHKPKPRTYSYSYSSKTTPKTTWGRDNNMILWEEEELEMHKKPDDYCKDCYRDEVVSEGLCKDCYNWYNDNMLW